MRCIYVWCVLVYGVYVWVYVCMGVWYVYECGCVVCLEDLGMEDVCVRGL